MATCDIWKFASGCSGSEVRAFLGQTWLFCKGAFGVCSHPSVDQKFVPQQHDFRAREVRRGEVFCAVKMEQRTAYATPGNCSRQVTNWAGSAWRQRRFVQPETCSIAVAALSLRAVSSRYDMHRVASKSTCLDSRAKSWSLSPQGQPKSRVA